MCDMRDIYDSDVSSDRAFEQGRSNRFTPRERQVARLVANGLTNLQISEELFITEGTVKKTVYNIYQKLGVHTRVQFLLKFIELSKNNPQTHDD